MLSVRMEEHLSIIHFNCRSLYRNFNTIKKYQLLLKQSFSIIAMSETWFREERGIDYEIEGYKLIYVNRTDKLSGGVAMYINKNLRFKIVENMTLAIHNILECVTIEIFNNKKKNDIVSCIYRTHSSDLDLFNDWMERTFSTINNKTIYICGDFNIDLLTPKIIKVPMISLILC